MVTRRKYVTTEDLDKALKAFKTELKGEFTTKIEIEALKGEMLRAFDVAIETIRGDIKVFGEHVDARLTGEIEMVKAVVREHAKDIASLKAK